MTYIVGDADDKAEVFFQAAYDATLNRIVAIGSSGSQAGDAKPLVARFTMDGALDTTFGSGTGYVLLAPPDRPTESFAGYPTPQDLCLQVKVDRLGRYVIMCYSASAVLAAEPVMLRLNSDGSFNR